jgi:hypothetical protein
VVIVGLLTVQGRLVRFVDGLPPPPPRWARLSTAWKLLHIVLVSPSYPLVNHRVTVLGQETRVTFPHECRGMIDPTLREAVECAPYLVSLTSLFP